MAAQRGTRVVANVAALAVPVVVLAAVVALGIALWSRGDLNRFICDGDCGASNIVPPAELTTGSSPSPVTPASPPDTGAVDPARLSAAVTPGLDADVLGSRVGFAAVSPDGTELMSTGGTTYTPASTTKLLTGFAALATIDPNTRFSTRVVRSADGVVLVGGGDPYLAAQPAKSTDDRVYQADLRTLARRTAAVLKKQGVTSVALGYDASLFSGTGASPTWEPSYVTQDIVTPIAALWVDQGVSEGGRARDPAAAAARTFVEQLEKRGITVQGDPASTVAPAGAAEVAEVRSATLAQIVETLIRVSDNEAAEVVLRHVAVAAGREADFGGGVAEVRAALEGAGIDTTGLELHDGSGLSRANRISPATLVGTLRAAMASPRLSGLMADLPVSGFTGTLVRRFAELEQARGVVRAKTGTLTGVHSLAGYALDADGRPVLFAVMADGTDRDLPLGAQAALDRIAASITSCHCG